MDASSVREWLAFGLELVIAFDATVRIYDRFFSKREDGE